MKKVLMLVVMAVFVFGFIGQAADIRFRVYVIVQCENENIRAAVESYVKRELRALQDVDITTKFEFEDATYFLAIVAGEAKLSDGRKTGYTTIAYCFFQRLGFPPPPLDFISGQTEAVKRYIQNVEEFAFDAPTVGYVVGFRDDLKRLCERIVVSFDTDMLDPDRKAGL